MSKARLIYFAVFAILIAAALLPALQLVALTGRTTARRSRVKPCALCSPFSRLPR